MLNQQYKDKEVLIPIQEVLNETGSIQLQGILDSKPYLELLNKMSKFNLKKEYSPESHSYHSSKFTDKDVINLISKFISELFTRKPELKSATLYKFKHRDYTLLQDDISEKKGVTVILELTKEWDLQADGYTTFFEDNAEISRINPIPNSLAIILTNKNMKSFIKYINHYSKTNERIFIELKFS